MTDKPEDKKQDEPIEEKLEDFPLGRNLRSIFGQMAFQKGNAYLDKETAEKEADLEGRRRRRKRRQGKRPESDEPSEPPKYFPGP